MTTKKRTKTTSKPTGMSEKEAWRRAFFWFGVILVVGGLLGLITHASADDNIAIPFDSPAITGHSDTQDASGATMIIQMNKAGDPVYTGDHIDTSNILYGTKAIAYFGGGEPQLGLAPQKMILLPEDAHNSLWYNFYVDPEFAANYTGMWYKWDGTFHPNENAVAFNVVNGIRTDNLTKAENVTVYYMQLTSNESASSYTYYYPPHAIPITNYTMLHVPYGGNITNQTNVTIVDLVKQGQVVYPGDHVDISRVVGGYSYLAYYGGGGETDLVSPMVIPLPSYREEWYNFYLDPSFFKTYPGMWYKWSGYYEPNANNEVFYVAPMARGMVNGTMTFPNGTVVKGEVMSLTQMIKDTETRQTIGIPTVSLLPVRAIADNIIVQGQPYTFTQNGTFKVWVFGMTDKLYDITSVEGNVTLTGEQTQTLGTGNYKVLIQTNGTNGIFEASYDEKKNSFVSPWKQVQDINLDGMIPYTSYDKLKGILDTASDDKYIEQSAVVQMAAITINNMNEAQTYSANAYYNAYDLKGNVTLYDVRGYTNAANGTVVRVALDMKDQNPNHIQWFTSTAISCGLGNMSDYQVWVPLPWIKLRAGVHELTARTDVGGEMTTDFVVNEMPANSYIPPDTVKWVGDENPWKANMTSEVKTVYINDTKYVYLNNTIVLPANETQIKIAQDAAVADFATRLGEFVIYCGVCIGLGYYGMSVIRRSRRERS